MRIEDLLCDPRRREFAAVPEVDALADPGALQEASLIAVRVDAVWSRAWLLLGCRGALHIEMANTAVVAVAGLQALSWAAEPRATARTHWTVVDWSPSSSVDRWQVQVATEPVGRLVFAGAEAEFFVGDVAGGDAAAPDFVRATDEEIRAGVPGWSSEVDVLHAVFTRP